MKKMFVAVAFMACLFQSLLAKTELVVSYAYPWFNDLHNKLKEEFEKQNPDITIKFVAPTQNYEEQSARILREKVINKLPDVTFNSYSYLPTMAEKKVAIDMSAYLNDKESLGLSDSMLAPTTIDSKVYGIPFASSLPVVYYNMDLVKKAGWDKPLPRTWDELFELSDKVNAIGKNSVFFGETDTWLILALGLQRGGVLVNEKGKADFTTKAWQEAFEILSQLHTRAKMPPLKRSEAIASFYAGNIAAVIQTSAALTITEQSVKFPLQLAKFPQPSLESKGKLPVGGSVVMLTNTKNKEAAMKYILFVTGEVNKFVPQYTGYMTSNAKAITQLRDFFAKNPNYTVAPSQIELMTKWPAFPGNNTLKATNTLWIHAEKLLLGQSKDSKGIAAQATKEINKLLP